jgi:6-phosphofructokinase
MELTDANGGPVPQCRRVYHDQDRAHQDRHTGKRWTSPAKPARHLGLDALVVVGGDDSNTNAAFLAQEMLDDGIQVIGVPKTIDGDIQVRDAHGKVLCAMSFGFHTAARAFSQDIANLCTDASSDRSTGTSARSWGVWPATWPWRWPCRPTPT